MTENLPALITRASQRLAHAKISAEVIEAKHLAESALHYAKLTSATHETHADCLRIITRAEMRMADEVDQGQERGEIAAEGQHGDKAPQSLGSLGLNDRRVADWRKTRDAGAGVVEEAIGEALGKDKAPTRADIMRAVTKSQQIDPPDVPPIAGKYDVIVIDPPWPMQKIERDVRPRQAGFDYKSMSLDEIAAYPVSSVAMDDCHLFCWTTQKFLPSTIDIIEGWGFKYVCTFVWHKAGGYQPVGLPQYNCEFVIYGRKGSVSFVDTKAFSTCFDAGRREHSRKPKEFYETVARVTKGSRVDIFSREVHDGFAQHGNEKEKFK